jgi:uncharacterized protein (DUF362 family)
MTFHNTNSTVYTTTFSSWQDTVPRLLDATCLSDRLAAEKRILLKPNLVEPKKPPITTPVGLVEALVDYILAKQPHLEIIIGEGCGSATNNTMQIFEALGYNELAARKGISLLDLNEASLIHKRNGNCSRLPEIYLPETVYESFLLSVPVLKAHSLAGVTLTMKNMIGLAPPAYYQQGGHWKKTSFHQRIQEAIFDLNQYRNPDFTLLDATIGMQEAHLWGPTCDPPPNRLAAGYDPVAMDSYGCSLLGIEWNSVGHLKSAHGVFGKAAPLTVHNV